MPRQSGDGDAAAGLANEPTLPGSVGRKNDHPAVRLLALRLTAQSSRRDGIVHNLALEGGHGAKPFRHATAPDFRRGILAQLREFEATANPVPADIQHYPGPHTGLPVHSQPGQFLECLKYLAARADQLLKRRPDHRDKRPVPFDVHVYVTVKVGHVEQTFNIVRGDLTLLLEIRRIRLRTRLTGIGTDARLFLACYESSVLRASGSSGPSGS